MSEVTEEESATPWTARVLTLFPEMFPGPLGFSLGGKALQDGLWRLDVLDIRDFARDKHRAVDDAPFGGGAGMVMRPDVIDAALAAALSANGGGPVIYLSPRGRLLDQARVRALAAGPGVTLLCGRYEGVDERVLEAHGLEEASVGDYVLSGGEPAALVLLDAVVRLLPGVMGNAESAAEESFGPDSFEQDSLGQDSLGQGMLEYPHYTRPAVWQGRGVPEVLLSGHHENIRRWRLEQAREITRRRRPDLWARLSHEEVEGQER